MLLGVGAELATPENRQDGDRIVVAECGSADKSINQVEQALARRNLNFEPTLASQPGLPVRIIVNWDLVLRPYQPLFLTKESHHEHDQEAAAWALLRTESVKLTLFCPADLKTEADRYATLHTQTYGEMMDAVTLIPH